MLYSKNIIAFDIGTKNVGVAVGQPITYTATPLTAFKIKNGTFNWKYIDHLFNEWLPSVIVVGLPLNMDGSKQPLTKYSCTFANLLHFRFKIKVILHDERLSTIEACSNLFGYGGYRLLTKDNIDAESAVVILESWLRTLT